MRQVLRDKLAGVLLVLALAAPAKAENAGDFRAALIAAQGRDWAGAAQMAARSGPVAQAVVDWYRLRAGQGSFADYARFAADYGDWPGMDLLWRRAEPKLTNAAPPEIVAWFASRAPLTIDGDLALISALSALNDPRAQAEVARTWRDRAMTEEQETAFFAAHSGTLTPADHQARLTGLLDAREWQAARRMLDYQPHLVDAGQAQLAFARIALQSGAQGVDNLILPLPPDLREDAGLAMDRFLWRVQAKRNDLAQELLRERSTSAGALRDPAVWASRRVDYTRAAMRAGNWPLAYELASRHFLTADRPAYSDLEWLAGYAALNSGRGSAALEHFRHLETVVGTAISLSRALYWQGRAYEALGQPDEARATYTRAATHQTAYYGQLAAERIGAAMDPALAVAGPGAGSLPDWRGTALRQDPRWQAAVWLFVSGETEQAQRFLLHLAQTAPPEDTARMARMAIEWHQPAIALRLAKVAAGKGAIWPAAFFPLSDLATSDLGVPPELALSIARRESEFNPLAVSQAGARGLMQVMPGTAQMMAAQLGEDYDLTRLTSDAHYNARLGGAYLANLRERFGPSIALVAAGYNAGPGRPARWITERGDPRRAADAVDWVEMIPFDETRNYVMRVTESLPIYRARLAGAPVALTPTEDLRGGGFIPPQAPKLTQSSRPVPAPADLAAAFFARVATGLAWRVTAPPGDAGL